MILKIVVPFAVISANLGILNCRLGVAPSSLVMLVMAISDVLTMNFFWLVKDEGSWLDIGTSITNFAIASLLCVFVAGLEFVSEVFISGVEVGGEAGQRQEKPMNGLANGIERYAHANGLGGPKENGILQTEEQSHPR